MLHFSHGTITGCICLFLHILRAFMISAEALKYVWRALFFLYSRALWCSCFIWSLERNASVSNFSSWKVWKCLTPFILTCSLRKSVDLWKTSSLNIVNTEREPCNFERRDFVSTSFPLAFVQKKKGKWLRYMGGVENNDPNYGLN